MAAKPQAVPTSPAKPEPAPPQGQRGFAAFTGRLIEKFRGKRPDHTHDGFMAAATAACLFAGTKNWEKVDFMLDEVEHRIRESCRVAMGVYAEFVARDQKTGYPRILIVTDWGFREAFEGPISFAAGKSDRASRSGA